MMIAHPTYNDITQFDNTLYVSSAGYYCNTTDLFHTTRKSGRNDYHLLYVECGEMCLKIHSCEWVLKPGSFAFIDYGVPHEYYAVSEKTPSYYWVHFKGSLSRELLADLNFNRSFVYTCSLDQNVVQDFIDIISELKYQGYMYLKRSQMHLVRLLLKFSQIAYEEANNVQLFNKFEAVKTKMRLCNCGDMTVDDFASMCNLSKSRFIKNFKRYTGMTPIEYKNTAIIERAKWHLHHTELSIADISELMGFNNPSYFSILFKKYVNCSPNEYRKNGNDYKGESYEN